MKNILFISGSLRKESVNTKLLKAFEKALPEGATAVWADINLPLFNEDLESDFPAEAQTLREQMLGSDLIIIAAPEYNRGMTGVLKNAIDWASRPYGKNAWVGKKVLVTSSSPGAIGGALALYQVKQSLMHLNADVIGQPEFMVGGAYDKFDESGELTDESTKEHIEKALQQILG
jgi:chromate reductase